MLLRTRCLTTVAIACLGAAASPAEAQEDTVPEWEGSFGVENQDISTRFKLSGFAELSIIRDSDSIATPCDFETAAIGTGAAGQASRVSAT